MPAGSSHLDHHPGGQITGELVVGGRNWVVKWVKWVKLAHLGLSTGEGALPQAVRQVPNEA